MDPRKVSFPTDPPYGTTHSELGRTWEYVEPGMWKSKDGEDGWDNITDKPGQYPPEDHLHVIADVQGLQVELDSKALKTDLDTEVQARIDGDANLQDQIDNLDIPDAYDDTQIKADLATETQARIDGDANLQSQIDNIDEAVYDDTQIKADLATETQSRIDGDAALQSQIDGLEAYDDTQIKADLTTETQARIDGDANLQDQIDNLDIPDAYDDTQIKADLATETQARIDGDANLQDQIDNIDVAMDEPASDGKPYSRTVAGGQTVGTWTEAPAIEEIDRIDGRIDAIEGNISGGGGFVEAPDDGEVYARDGQAPAWVKTYDAEYIDAIDAAYKNADAALQDQIDALPDQDFSWDSITGKPTEFPPEAHDQDWGTITGKPADYPPSAHNHGWGEIADKPSEFPPETHGHEIDDVNGLQDALDAAGGTPAWDDVTGKPTEFPPEAHTQGWDTITDKPTEFPPEAHNQGWDTITDKPADYPPSAHDHAWDSITGKPADYPPSVHGHEIDDVNGLQDALDAAGGAPAWDDVTGKPTDYPPASHNHDGVYQPVGDYIGDAPNDGEEYARKNQGWVKLQDHNYTGADAVKLTGDQSVAGHKTWTDVSTFGDTVIMRGTLNGDDTANFQNAVTAGSFVKTGGTSSEYLMADGSVTTGAVDGGGTGAGMVISDTPPADKVTGMQWLDSTSGDVFIWDEDKWIEFPAGKDGKDGAPGADGISVWEQNGDDIYYNDGNVGIGTNATYRFNVLANSGWSVSSNFVTESTQSTIAFADSNTNNPNNVRIGSEGDNLVAFTNGDPRLTIDANGYATFSSEVRSENAGGAVWINATDQGATSPYIRFWGNQGGSYYNVGRKTTDGNFHINVGANFDSPSNEALTIDPSGNATFSGRVKSAGDLSFVKFEAIHESARTAISQTPTEFSIQPNGETSKQFAMDMASGAATFGGSVDTPQLNTNQIRNPNGGFGIGASGGGQKRIVPVTSDGQAPGEIDWGSAAIRWKGGYFAGTVDAAGFTKGGVPLIATRDLIETLSTLRTATQDETTIEGLRDSISNAIGGLIEKFEAMQTASTQEISDE